MVNVRIPAPLRPKTAGQAQVAVQAGTLYEAIESLIKAHPDLQDHLIGDDGELNRFVNYFVNGTNVRQLDGPDTKLDEGDTVLVLPAVAGGASNPDAPASGTNGGHQTELSPEELRFYGRHLILPEVGREGQVRLKDSSVIVVGAGGLGAPALFYLAAAGVGRIGIVDPDVVEASNLHRQILYTSEDEGRGKVEVAKQRLQALNPNVTVKAHQERLTSENALKILEPYDVVLDGTDNFQTRYLVNDASVLLGKPNVHASIFRFEGQASVFWADKGPCYRCLYPQPPPPGLVPSCAEGGVLGVLPGTLGVLQATEAIKILLGKGQPLTGRLVLYNALEATFEEVGISKDPDCPVCGEDPEVTELIDYEAFCGIEPASAEGEGDEVTVQELARRLEGDEVFLLDVREPWEHDIVNLEQATLIPLDDLPDRVSELPQDREIVVHCRTGARSAKATEFLRSLGLRAYNLEGGITAWAEQIEPDKPTY